MSIFGFFLCAARVGTGLQVCYDLLGARLGASVPETLTLTEDPVYIVR